MQITANIAKAIDLEAAQWAEFFNVTDPEQIEGRKQVMRANVTVFGFIDPLVPFMPRALQNLRRDLREKSWLKYSAAPFAGAVHDFSVPMAKRLKSREHVGPYYWSPTEPGKGRGFYQSSKGLFCDKSGSTFDLRLEEANDHLRGSRLAQINGYFCDEDGEGDTLKPIVARLPHGRGYLAGWTMGRGMAASLDCSCIWDDIEDAARAAHDLAESDADDSREKQQAERDKESRFETLTGTAPSHWACYFINGDSSGMEDSEIELADKFAEWLGGSIVGCEDAGFMHHHDASQFGVGGADCQTYSALIEKDSADD